MKEERKIRVWTIGRLTDSPQTTVVPTKEMIERLKSELKNLQDGITDDIIVGPEVTVKEYLF
jgi:hypothetical protein